MCRITAVCCVLVWSAVTSLAVAVPIATATLKQTGSNTFEMLLTASPDANFGVATYNLPIQGATTFTHKSPRASFFDGEGFAVNFGFSLYRSPANQLTVRAAQHLDPAVPVAYGLGQRAGNLLNDIGLLTTTVFDPASPATYQFPMVIGSGTFSGSFANVKWNNVNDLAAVQLYESRTKRSGPLTLVSRGDLILATESSEPPPVLTSSPVPGAGIECVLCAGDPRATSPIALSNTGGGIINVSSITLAGANAANFIFTGTLPTQLVAGAAPSTFNVAWGTPGQPAGVHNAQVLVNTSSGNLVFDVTVDHSCPEPSTITQLVAAIGALVLFAHRKRSIR
jgi:hypothetical protein